MRESVKESTLNCSGSNRAWIENQVRLKAFTLDTSIAYILWRQLPKRQSIGGSKYSTVQGMSYWIKA